MINNFLRFKVISLILLGIVIGITLFILGDIDDAPGLSFIGIIVSFLLIMRGIYYSKIIQNGYHIPIILFVFGMMSIILPIILILDGEINILSSITFIGNIIGITMIAIASIRIIKVIKINNKF